jgi:phytoene dehydrogenase-like protein
MWDVIVIGAGIGGLTAAARLVKAGLRVLMLEKSLHPGGTAYTYSRRGYIFPMGPLGFSTPGLVRGTLADLGQGDDLHLHRVHYQVVAFGVQIRLSLPFDQMKIELKRFFPDESEGVEQFFRDMDMFLSARCFPTLEIDDYVLEARDKTSADDHLRALIRDPRLCKILGSLGTREPFTSFPLLAAQWNLMCNEGIWYPEGGMDALCRTLAKAVTGDGFNKHGKGELRLGAPVSRIRAHDGSVSGVTLADGTEIDATGIISNADYKTTFMKLVERRDIPEPWYHAICKAKQSGSVFQVCLGVDATRVDLSVFSDASRLIYRHHTSGATQAPVWKDFQVDPEAMAGQELEVSLWSRENPRLAPNGGAVVVVRTEADYAHFMRYRPAEGKRDRGYREYKMRLAEALVREVGNLVPGLEHAVLVIDVATPLTFEERGGRSQGAVAGWSWDYEDNPGYRPSELIQTPIHGLYMAGYQAYSALFMGGLPMAMASGRRAAEAFLEGTGPVRQVQIPGAVGPDASAH